MTDTDQTPVSGEALPDPGNSDPKAWTADLDEAELADALAVVDDPQDPLVLAGLAGTLYAPDAGTDADAGEDTDAVDEQPVGEPGEQLADEGGPQQ